MAKLQLGFELEYLAYRVFVFPVISFIMQLEADHPELTARFQEVLRKLAPGPGNWISVADLFNLKLFGFKHGFKAPEVMALSTKLRVINDIARDWSQKHGELKRLQHDIVYPRHGEWHRRCHYSILHLPKGCSTRKVAVFQASKQQPDCNRR